MGKPTGFIDYARCRAADRPADERINDFAWIHRSLDSAARKEQAARCMDCGVPFCQTEMKQQGQQAVGCPLRNLIPQWNEQLYNDNLPLALERLLKTNCFPEFTGYVCPAPCERACSCRKSTGSVSINDNERYIIDTAFEQGLMQPRVPSCRSGKRVAVVGSGPAGLSVAHLLNQRGHQVVVFEREASAGGLLVYGIPSMKLPYEVVERRIELMKAEGVEFRCGVNVGEDLRFEELTGAYDAVVVAVGAQKPREVPFEGSAQGVCYALEYMGAVTRWQRGEDALADAFNAAGKSVAIVGAGNSANDCIATALRQGCTDVVQIIRRPASDYGAATDYAHEEAYAKFGRDIRRFQSNVVRVVPDENGQLASLELSTADSAQSVPAQMLVIASGFTGAEDTVTRAIPRDADNLFYAGDMELGASLVVRAMAHARQTARVVDVFLNGYSPLR